MSCDLIIHGGSVVFPDQTIQADIAVDQGKILKIGQTRDLPPARRPSTPRAGT